MNNDIALAAHYSRRGIPGPGKFGKLTRIVMCSIGLAVVGILVPCLIHAQDARPIVIGHEVKFHSRILQEDIALWISAPDTAHSTASGYPVMILLDAEAHFVHAEGIVQFLSAAGRMPEMLVVGIESNNRVRDFTPASSDTSMSGSGGAGKFLQFMRDELLPFVESHYRTAPYRVLVGHSLGGSLTLDALLTSPQMFNAYFILSPNLWWGNDTLVQRLEVFLQKPPKVNAFVYETHTTKESSKNITATAQV